MENHSSSNRCYRLSCQVKNYEWGKLGSTSAVAKLAHNAIANPSPIDDKLPYAELWMGTHPNAPSILYDFPNISLRDKLASQPDLLTLSISKRFSKDLPFLFKVLSVRKALSIQAHPDLKLAKTLHQKYPDKYKDSNHKPEMTIALTSFEALCGFRGLEEIAIHFDLFPEFAQVVGHEISEEFVGYVREFNVKRRASIPSSPSMGEENDDNDKRVLRRVFESLLTSDPSNVALNLKLMVKRINETMEKEKSMRGTVQELIVRLYEQYPNDVGCFCALLLNYVELRPGQAIFLQANEPHAYLSGDCVECMATSDNVIRAGLTPKFKDVQTLVNMLTYKSYSCEDLIMEGQSLETENNVHSRLFRTPIDEFSIVHTQFTKSNQIDTFDKSNGVGVLLCVSGSGSLSVDGSNHLLQTGTVYFIGANASITLKSSEEGTSIFRAFCNLS